MLLCAADRISKMWGGTPVFQQLTLDIHEGERIGLVGPNGCGKTTVLKLLAGAEPPDAGAIRYKKGSRVALLAQIPEYAPGTTALEVLREAFADLLKTRERLTELEALMADPDTAVAEKALREYGASQEAYAAQGGYEMEANVSRVANGLGIASLLQTPFGRLSGGERTKVCLGRILLLAPDLLLLDEPTNHLDLQAVEWLETYLQDYRGSVLIVSHDRYFLDRVAGKIYDLKSGTVDVYPGNYSAFVVEKERRLLLEFAAYQEQQKKIAKMEEAIKRLRTWAAQADNPALFKRATAMRKALDRMTKLSRPVLERQKMKLAFEMDERSGQDVIVMDGVGKSFGVDGDGAIGGGSGPAEGGRLLYANLNMLVRFGEAAAIVGGNGSGKSTLLRMIADGLEPDAGTVKLGSRVKIGYLAQHDLFPDEEKTVVEAFRDKVAVEEGEARRMLARFLFYGAAVFRKVKDLSGGERMRLRLAQLMHQETNVLVLDEPTNHLDIDAREALEDTLAAFPGTIVCVSHDRYLLNKLFPVTFWLEAGILMRYEGRYEEARRKREEQLKRLEPQATGRTGASESAGASRSAAAGEGDGFTDSLKPRIVPAGRDPRRERDQRGRDDPGKRINELETGIELIERKIALLDDAMLNETDLGKLSALHGEKTLLEAERELQYEQLDRLGRQDGRDD